MPRTLLALGLSFILGALSAEAFAQTDEPLKPLPLGPISTDRPTQATAPIIQPRRTFQLEAGYDRNSTSSAQGDTSQWNAPSLLLRYGISKRFEARLGGLGWTAESDPDGTKKGLADVVLSTKILLAEERGARPQMGLLFDLSLPVGDSDVASDTVDPTVVFLALNNLTDRLALTYNLKASLVTAEIDGASEENVDLGWSAVLSGSVGEPFSLFGEVYGAVPSGQDRKNSLAIQSGAMVLLGRRFQIDFRGGVGLAGDEPDWLIGIGLAYRIPR